MRKHPAYYRQPALRIAIYPSTLAIHILLRKPFVLINLYSSLLLRRPP